MTDDEITLRCAKLMGHTVYSDCAYIFLRDGRSERYEPLSNDGQAMALLKRFRLKVLNRGYERVGACLDPDLMGCSVRVFEAGDLNRAVVECVAYTQKLSK